MNGDLDHGWFYRRLVLPILALLRMGATPEKLAWSIATGIMIGINPMLGTTTILCLAIAFAFRLNVAASQLANHVVYPLQLLLVIPFLHLGSRVFHTAQLPLSPGSFLRAARSNPIALTTQLWIWEWHATTVWTVIAIIGTPLLALSLMRPLRQLMIRVNRHQYPVLSAE